MAEQSSGKKTFWQLVKFTIVSMLACIVQVASLAALYNIPAIKALSAQAFHWFVFDYPVIEGKQCGLALFIAFNTSNVLAQIVAFFVNRKKTFNADNNVPVTLTIYLIFTAALICSACTSSVAPNSVTCPLRVSTSVSSAFRVMA